MHYVHQDVQLKGQEELGPSMSCWRRTSNGAYYYLIGRLIQLKDASPSAGLRQKNLKTQELETCGADSAARRADELLQNLGSSEALRKRKMRELSGGWRALLAGAVREA